MILGLQLIGSEGRFMVQTVGGVSPMNGFRALFLKGRISFGKKPVFESQN